MIVVDANVLAYFWLPSSLSEAASECFKKDSDWIAPTLWRSEFRNILALYLRKGYLDFSTAKKAMTHAEEILQYQEYIATSTEVLELVMQSSCSAYDCEYIALARKMGVKLITKDKQLLKEFPRNTVDLESFI